MKGTVLLPPYYHICFKISYNKPFITSPPMCARVYLSIYLCHPTDISITTHPWNWRTTPNATANNYPLSINRQDPPSVVYFYNLSPRPLRGANFFHVHWFAPYVVPGDRLATTMVLFECPVEHRRELPRRSFERGRHFMCQQGAFDVNAP